MAIVLNNQLTPLTLARLADLSPRLKFYRFTILVGEYLLYSSMDSSIARHMRLTASFQT
jgi:hypothetical protein